MNILNCLSPFSASSTETNLTEKNSSSSDDNSRSKTKKQKPDPSPKHTEKVDESSKKVDETPKKVDETSKNVVIKIVPQHPKAVPDSSVTNLVDKNIETDLAENNLAEISDKCQLLTDQVFGIDSDTF